jgi:hypothetical protein
LGENSPSLFTPAECLEMENAVTFYRHLEYFTAVWYMYFMAIGLLSADFGILYHEKSGNPVLHYNPLLFFLAVMRCIE